MKYIVAIPSMADDIKLILHMSIKESYSMYYPTEVVEFFLNLHNKDHILHGISSGNMGVLIVNDKIVGTGCYDANHITSVYVAPEFQNKGYGTHIMNCLEDTISKNYKTAVLDASLAAVLMYENRGYTTIGHGKYDLPNGKKLVYEIMEKQLSNDS